LPRTALRAPDAALLGRDAQFVVFDPEYDLISNLDAKGFAKRRWDHNPAVLVDTCPSF
jgi:hypothetical protein